MDIEFMRTTLLEMFTPAHLTLMLALMVDDGRTEGVEGVLPASVESLLATLSGRYEQTSTCPFYHHPPPATRHPTTTLTTTTCLPQFLLLLVLFSTLLYVTVFVHLPFQI